MGDEGRRRTTSFAKDSAAGGGSSRASGDPSLTGVTVTLGANGEKLTTVVATAGGHEPKQQEITYTDSKVGLLPPLPLPPSLLPPYLTPSSPSRPSATALQRTRLAPTRPSPALSLSPPPRARSKYKTVPMFWGCGTMMLQLLTMRMWAWLITRR